MERWRGKVAVVTGASSGIGAAIAKRLLQEGLIVVGIARRKAKIEELAKDLETNNGKLYAIGADVSNEEEVLQAFKWIKSDVGPIHILVNSAGISRVTNLVDGSTKMWKEIMDINFMANCITTKEAIASMQENNIDGHIIFINSIGGHRVINLPTINVLPASKYALTAYIDTLRNELTYIESDIKVTDLSPGVVDTEIFEASAVGSGKPDKIEFVKSHIAGTPHLNPSDLADAAIYVLGTPPHVQVHRMIIKPIREKI